MDPLLLKGVELMLLGMGVVFSFLLVLVFTMTGMSLLVNRLFPEQEPEPAPVPAAPAPEAGDIPPRTLAVIRKAIEQHRAQRARVR